MAVVSGACKRRSETLPAPWCLQASIHLFENAQADPRAIRRPIHQAVLMAAKARYRVAWQSPNSRRAMLPRRMGLRNLKCRNPLKSMLFAALMNLGQAGEPDGRIRNFIIRQNRMHKQRNSHPRTAALYPFHSFRAVKELGRQRFMIAIGT